MKKHKSPIKAARADKKKHIRNVSYLSKIKTVSKILTLAVVKGEKDKVDGLLKTAISTIDKGHSKGIIHKNTASRKISRFSKKVVGLKQKSGAVAAV